ncbi:MAG: hypothetical protein LBT26_00220 [Clostridiales Family XIII bacterium]|jgi:hypothetical protein|nr:hypothetical protein [Clostridiales Family XIII bacterium]
MERDLIAVEYKDSETKRNTTVIGVVGITLLDDGLLLTTEDAEKSVKLAEDPIRRRELKMHVYYPNADDLRELLGNAGMFEHGPNIIDGRSDAPL